MQGGYNLVLSLVFDISIAVICLIIILRNAIKGFIKSFISLMKSVLAVFLAYLFNGPLARALSDWFFNDLSVGWVKDLMVSTQKEGGYALYEIFDGIPDWFTKVSISQGIEESTVQHYFVESNLAPIEIVDELSALLGNALSMLISTVIAFLVIFIAIELVLIGVGALLNKLGKIPVWRVVNIILGALIGAIISAVIAWLISFVIVFIFEFGANYYPDTFNTEVITNTVIVEFFKDHNLFTIVRGWFI